MTTTEGNQGTAGTTAPRSPDRPALPRPRRSIFAGIMAGFCALVVGGYTAMAFTEYELGAAEKDELPASVRSTPGGYRSYSYWHSGYHGGK
jgi:hypothetical protein